MIDPIPNNTTEQTLVGDFAISADATWALDANGEVSYPDVPSGSAYIGRNEDGRGTLTFGFSSTVYSVGALVDAVSGSGVSAAAYDAAGKLITAADIASVPVADWDSNLVSLVSKVPIAKVVFTGDYVILDELTFDTSTQKVVKGTPFGDNINNHTLVNGHHPTNEAEVILGRGGNDKIDARDGDDLLDGGKGNDKLHGGDGSDTLIGGKGQDKLFGEAGQDFFLFRDLSFVDKVNDFSPADDAILLDHTVFSTIPLGQLDPSQFQTSATATDADDRVLYDPASGKLYYDADGNGPTEAIQFAKLAAGLALTSADFAVV